MFVMDSLLPRQTLGRLVPFYKGGSTEDRVAKGKLLKNYLSASTGGWPRLNSEKRRVGYPCIKNPAASRAGKVYRGRFVATRLAATLLADGAPCFAIRAFPALVIKRDCSYISIHFSLEIAEISLPIASSGKSSGDSK